jgi:nitric oxide reductase
MVEPFFTRKHVDDMRPHIQKTVNSLLDSLIEEGGDKPFDIVDKFSLPVPSYVRDLLRIISTWHTLKDVSPDHL